MGGFDGPRTEARPDTALSQVSILLGDAFLQSHSVAKLHTVGFLTQAILL